MTITTVSYGDLYPVTQLGRMVGALLMIAGIGIFGTFTAYVAATFFQQSEKEEEKREQDILAELKTIREKLEKLEQNPTKGPQSSV